MGYKVTSCGGAGSPPYYNHARTAYCPACRRPAPTVNVGDPLRGVVVVDAHDQLPTDFNSTEKGSK